MKIRILNICLAVLLIAVGYVWGNHATAIVHAQMRVNIPKAYGKIIGTPAGFIVLEDETGVIRVVEINGSVDAVITRN